MFRSDERADWASLSSALIRVGLTVLISVAWLAGCGGGESNSAADKGLAETGTVEIASTAIMWSPPSIAVALKPGSFTKETVTVSSSDRRALTNLVVEIPDGLRPYLTVTPLVIDTLNKDNPVSVNLEFAAPVDALPEVHEGALRLVSGRRTVALPLPMTLTIDDNPIQLTAPDLSGSLLPQLPAVLKPRINYRGDGVLNFQLIQGPETMSLGPDHGILTWTPTAADQGREYTIVLQASDGVHIGSVMFSVRVAELTLLETIVEVTGDGRNKIIVTDPSSNLLGLTVNTPSQYYAGIDPEEAAISPAPPALYRVDPVDVLPAGDFPEDAFLRLTDFFRIEPISTDSDYIEIIFPEVPLPPGRHREELTLFVLADAYDAEGPTWIPLVNRRMRGHDEAVIAVMAATGPLGFIGLDVPAEAGSIAIMPLNTETSDTLDYVLTTPFRGIRVAPIVCKSDALVRDIQLCTAALVSETLPAGSCPFANLSNCTARIRVSGFSEQRWADASAGLRVHDVAGWAIDAMTKLEALGLLFDDSGWISDTNIKIKIHQFKNADFSANCSGGMVHWWDNERTLHLNSFDKCSSPASIKFMRPVLAHEYFHHSQDRTGNVLNLTTYLKTARHWLSEGTADWFADEVFDDDNLYLGAGCGVFPGCTLPSILDVGANAVHKGSPWEYDGYLRSVFFKLLQRSESALGRDGFGCDFGVRNQQNLTFLHELFRGHGSEDNGGVRLKEVLNDSKFECQFGRTFGLDTTLPDALERYSYLTQIQSWLGAFDGGLSLLDHNEPPWVSFRGPGKTNVVGEDQINRSVITLPSLSAWVYLMKDEKADGQKRELRVRSLGSNPSAFVSVRGVDGSVKHRGVIRTSDVVVSDFNTWNDRFVTFVNADPRNEVALEFGIGRTGETFFLEIESLKTESCASYGMCTLALDLGEITDLAGLFIAIEWGDGDILSRISIEECIQAGQCRLLDEGRIGVWKGYKDVGEFVGTVAFSFDGQPFISLPFVVNVPELRPLVLSAAPGDSRVDLTWANVGADRYNVCRATEPVAEFDNCSVYAGGTLILDVGAPPRGFGGLTNGTTYHFRVEAQFGRDGLTSEGASATPLALETPPVSGRLNDTGMTSCGEALSGNNVYCTGDEPWGQDAHYGRDAVALASALIKVGGGDAGFDFTKIANNGSELPASASRGSNPNDWACTRDNVTGLIWEVKVQNPSHRRHQGHTYTWYDPTSPDGNPGVENGGACVGSDCDTTGFVQAVNEQGLCGASDWRMPTPRELQGIVNYGKDQPKIDTAYFDTLISLPDTPTVYFWAGSPGAGFSNSAWEVNFFGGYVSTSPRSNSFAVRLVRGGH